MKRIFNLVVILLMISFASTSVFAQNEAVSNQSQSSETATVSFEQENPAEYETGADQKIVQDVDSSQDSEVVSDGGLSSLADLLNNTVGNKKQNILGAEQNVFVPIHKHGKINGHHICQRLELSVLGDKSETSKDLANKLFGGALTEGSGSSDIGDNIIEDLSNKTGGLGLGANFGYSLVFIPGYKEEGGNELLLNRFGFGYSVGVISQFDHEKNAGVSWDFLGKFGVETGFNKAIGVGIDFLFGGGKTSQTVVDFGDVDSENPDPDDLYISTESLWCAKAGTQLWLRLNFLTKSINNFDTALFSRFVYSFRPYSETDMLKRIETYDEVPVWQHEAWSFGFTMTYFF